MRELTEAGAWGVSTRRGPLKLDPYWRASDLGRLRTVSSPPETARDDHHRRLEPLGTGNGLRHW